MRLYVLATGLLFAVLVLLHLWRVVVEPHLARDPLFVIATLISASFAIAAWRVARRSA